MKEIEIGYKAGRLTILSFIEVRIKGNRKCAIYLAQCSCGNKTEVSGRTFFGKIRPRRSCGCLIIDRSREVNTKHGMKGSREYATWGGMKDRCHNPLGKDYDRYGARGIKVCKKWRDSFKAFYADMGEKPKGMTIDRINNDKDYKPSNCRWATYTEQARNRRGNLSITYKGEKMTASAADEMQRFVPGTVARRITKQGWNVKKAVETPTETSLKGNGNG